MLPPTRLGKEDHNPKKYALRWGLFSISFMVIICDVAMLHSKKQGFVSPVRAELGTQTAKDEAREDSRNKLAFCISGQLRSLANPVHRKNFFRAFFDPLSDGFTIDTFFNLDVTAQTESPEVLRILRNSFNPVNVALNEVNCSSWWCSNSSCIRSGYEQFQRLNACMEQISEHEKKQGHVYDFIFRIRPDIIFKTGLPRSHCWNDLRRDVVWDSAALFYGGGDIRVDKAANVDFLVDIFRIIPRELAESYMKGIANSYHDCIPEVEHTPENAAIDSSKILHKLYGDDFIGGCGKDNYRWRWKECRDLIILQRMDVYVGRLQDMHEVPTLARCRDPEDIWCTDAFDRWTGKSVKDGVYPRVTCFPADGYVPRARYDTGLQESRNDRGIQDKASATLLFSEIPKVAVCIVGDIRSFMRTDMQNNLHEAIYKPIAELHVDTFAFMGNNVIKGNSLVKTDLNVAELVFGKSKPVMTQVSPKIDKKGAMTLFRPNCQVLGYAEVARLRDCVNAISQHEITVGFQYDFILRTRPDIEYFESLPPAHCWTGLNPLVIWDMDTRFTTGIDKFHRQNVMSVKDADFVGDWLTLVPRDIAVKAFVTMADDFERCIPLEAPQERICGESNFRWGWPECRFKNAYYKADNRSLIGKFMTEKGANFQWNTLVRCLNANCTKVMRQDGQQHCHVRVCAYKSVANSPISSDLRIRTSCFPRGGYTRLE